MSRGHQIKPMIDCVNKPSRCQILLRSTFLTNELNVDMPSRVDVSQLCQTLLDKLFHSSEGKESDRDFDFPSQRQGFKELTSLLNKCIAFGESNSILIIGPRGSGKTHLVNNSLKKVLAQNSEQVAVVRLNGLLQTDDNIALEEITRQLKLENVMEDMVFGSFEKKLQFLLESLRTGTRNSQPIVIVLDEFHLFSEHKNQTLLYNLFDISQTNQTPICVVGLTCRLDTTELLEKRVKSRFSHRYIYLTDQVAYPELQSLLAFYLKHSESLCRAKGSLATQWNKKIDQLLLDPQIKDSLLFRFSISADMNSVKQLAALIITACSRSQALPDNSHFLESFKILDTDPKATMLQGLSIVELCLIIAMKQLTEIYSDEPFNFQMVYEHFRKFSERKSCMKTCPRTIAIKAFEHLIDLEIVTPADQSSKVLKQYQPMRLLVTAKEIDDAVLHYTGCPSEIVQWSYMDCARV
ncbi:origin recognition complex subunit 4-like [Watersipora subatra]|uniref:origin recognition complex subunit 4-like n=1 Tax=Watersipora subatra TaxID=2589382 RepID=UPI00355C6979